jgi:hypothetical protein
MYTGTLIEELMATVERAEQHAHEQAELAQLECWYAVAPYELSQVEPNLLGVA